MIWGISPAASAVPHLGLWSGLLFALAVLAALAVTRAVPVLGIALLILVDPFDLSREIGGTTLTLQKAVLAGVLIGLVRARMFRTPRRARVLWIAFGLTILTAALSAWHAGSHAAVLRETFKQIEYALLAWTACAIAANAEAPLVEQTLASSATIVTLVVGIPATLEAVLGGAPSGVWFDNLAIPRVAGPLEGPNQLAGFFEVMIPILVLAPAALGITALVRTLTLASAAAALVLTQSRAGFLAVGAETLVACGLDRGTFGRVRLGTFAGLAAGLLILGAWYGAALLPLLSGHQSRIAVVAAPVVTRADSAASARAFAPPPNEPSPAAAGPGEPVRIVALHIVPVALEGGNRLAVRLITTTNVSAAKVQVGRTTWNMRRLAVGTFVGGGDISYAMAPAAQLTVVVTATRPDGVGAIADRLQPVHYDPAHVRLETFQGLGGARDMLVARATDTQRIQAPGTVGSRRELWHAALALARRHPLTGIGAGNYELSLASVGLPDVRTNASSIWLQTLAEQGLLGLAALAVLVAAVIFGLVRGGGLRWTGAAAIIATAALYAHQLVDNLSFFPKIAAVHWILVGVAFGLAGRGNVTDMRTGPRPRTFPG